MKEIKERIVVVSDSHGHHDYLEKIKEYEEKVFNKPIIFLHAGDSEAKYEDQLCGFLSVRGNMDYYLDLPYYLIIPVYKNIIFITHGHMFYKDQIDNIMTSNHANICITGHTHMPSKQIINDKYYLNPGSIARPRFNSKKQYLEIDIDIDGNIKINDKFIEEI